MPEPAFDTAGFRKTPIKLKYCALAAFLVKKGRIDLHILDMVQDAHLPSCIPSLALYEPCP